MTPSFFKTYLKTLFLVLFILSAPAFAQSGGTTVENIAADPVGALTQDPDSIKKENIKHLIETLESDTARKELITNLQLLIDQQQKIEAKKPDTIIPEIPTLTEEIGLQGKIRKTVKEYNKFLDQKAISSSVVNQSVGSAVAVILATIFFFAVRKLAFKLIIKLDYLSEKIGVRLSRVAFYTKVLQFVFRVFIVGTLIYTLGKIWELSWVDDIFESSQMKAVLSTSVTVLFVATILAFVWESIGIYLAYILKQADDNNQTRVKTLLPIIRNIILSISGILFGLMLLSEFGIDVGPLLAGAGVVGVAIGFGAQSMVKDFLTGFTIVLEDVVRVGDVVTLGGATGAVEKITLRKIQLRDFAGIVSTIPFSQITTIQNLTKKFSFFVATIGVSYNQDTDTAMRVMRDVDEDLRNDPEFQLLILEPIEIVGVDQFADSAVMIKARIKTEAGKQWVVGREYNRRLKIAFDKNGIEIPFPQRVVTVRGDAPLPASALASVVD